MRRFDYIIVGSGCAGSMAAQTLLEAGKKVVMLDVGEANPRYSNTVPGKDFLSLRTTDHNQYKYFIGEKAEGVVVNDTGKGAQITPTRSHMLRHTDRYIPLESKTFTPIESLGYGGLGIGWGLQCWEFNRKELAEAGLPVQRMIDAYEIIAGRIGISGTDDAAAPYTLGELKDYHDSPTADRNMQRINGIYLRKKAEFDRLGVYLGRTPLAILDKDRGNRKGYAYRDMDFYDDNDQSGWRPWVTVNQLRKDPNFTYIDKFLATTFEERADTTVIRGIDTQTRKPVAYSCGKLVLACGALGTARLVLRSSDRPDARLPMLCNPYTYVPCLQPSMVGQGPERGKIGFGQLSAFLGDEQQGQDTSILTLYSYQSLMLFRIIRQAPLNFRDARILMQYLSTGLVVTGIQHSDKRTELKYLELTDDPSSLTGDALRATYALDHAELAGQRIREKRYIQAMRKTGVYALKKMNPGHGSSVHYAGTVPFSDKDEPLTLSRNGRVHGTSNVYVADSSGFNFLPARGLTFSLLANAHITAENVLHERR